MYSNLHTLYSFTLSHKYLCSLIFSLSLSPFSSVSELPLYSVFPLLFTLSSLLCPAFSLTYILSDIFSFLLSCYSLVLNISLRFSPSVLSSNSFSPAFLHFSAQPSLLFSSLFFTYHSFSPFLLSTTSLLTRGRGE